MSKPTTPSAPADALDKLRQHVRILLDLGRLAGDSMDLDAFLDQAVVQVGRAVEIDHVKVLRYRPDKGDLLVAAGVGWKPGVIGTATLSADLRSAPGRSFQTAEPVVIANFAEQDEYDISHFLKQHGIVSVANAPILIGGAAWGVLEVDSTVPRDFSQDTSRFLVAAGALIGICVRRHAAEPSQSEKLAAAVGEAQYRETLLREMQHRVKNSFQLILASLTLQKRRTASREVHTALDDIAARIKAISVGHDQLSPRDGGQAISLADYLRALCHTIRQQVEGIEIDVEADEVQLAIDRAVALGLILNEAVTNSIKHAFGESGGRIHVSLAAGIGYGEARLTVTDDGCGMTEENSGGSGLKLISALAQKIGGEVKRSSEGRGTELSVQFPAIA